MFKKGDYVMKIPEGICKIEDIGHPDLTGVKKDREYYFLVPLKDNSSKLYIPVDTAERRIRSVISKEDALKLIKSIPEIAKQDISNEKLREQEYKTTLLSGDSELLVSMIKSIYVRRQERIEQGKKTTAADDRYFKQAEDELYSELSFALDIPKEKMEQFIINTIENSDRC